jgi:transposase-like protein
MTTMTAAQIRAQTQPMAQPPDPQVPERPRPPRTYPAAYRLRILGEYEQLDKKGKGALLRREGLYTSLISEWRKQRDKGALAALGQGKRRGRPPVDPLVGENARLVADNARLRAEHRLHEPETPVDRASDEEIVALVKACRSARDRLIVLLMARAGLRRGEVAGLRRSDLHLLVDNRRRPRGPGRAAGPAGPPPPVLGAALPASQCRAAARCGRAGRHPARARRGGRPVTTKAAMPTPMASEQVALVLEVAGRAAAWLDAPQRLRPA